MKVVAFLALSALVGVSQFAVAQNGRLDPRFHATDPGAPIEQWPTEVLQRVSAAPETYSGDLSVSEVVEQVMTDLSTPDSTVSIEFRIPVVKDNQVLIDSSVMSSLPMEQARRDIDSYGFTEDEKNSSRIDAAVTVSFAYSEYQESASGNTISFADHVQNSLERYFVPGYNRTSANKDRGPRLQYDPNAAGCGGAAVGTEFSVTHTTSCLGTTVNYYQCQEYSVNGETRIDWMNTGSYYYPPEVDQICY